ncbi:MAG: RNA polymerase sigma factor [Acidimicrobiia bacterium]
MATKETRVGLLTHSEMYERHSHELVRFATSLVGPSDAADVVQEAVAALIASNRLDEAENPRALMYRAVLVRAKSMQRSAFRRRRREQRFAESIVVTDPERRPDVVAAVVRLSPQQKACVFLAYWEDMTTGQIADRLGIAEGTVKVHLARARERLRKVIGE